MAGGDFGEINMGMTLDASGVIKGAEQAEQALDGVKRSADEAGTNLDTNTNKMKTGSENAASGIKKSSDSVGKSFLDVASSSTTLMLGAYALYDSYDSVQMAQTAASRTALALSKANENLNAMQKAYNEAVATYGADSAEAEEASLNLAQAQEQVTIATEKAEMAAGNVDDAWVQFTVGGAAGVLSLISGGAGLIKSFKDLAGVLPTLGSAIGGIGKVFTSLQPLLVANPIILIATAIAAVVLIIITNWDAIKPYFEGIFNFLKGIFEAGWNAIKGIVETVWNVIKGIIDFVMGIINGIINFFMGSYKAGVEGPMNAIKGIFEAVWNAIKTIIDTVLGAIKAIIEFIWNAIVAYFTSVFNGIKIVVDTVWNAIKVVIETVMGVIKAVIEGAWNVIKTVVTTVNNVIKGIIDAVWNGIKASIQFVMGVIKGIFDTVWNAIKTVIQVVMGIIQTVIINPMNTIKNTVTTILNAIKAVFEGVFNAIVGIVKGAIDTVKGIIDGIKGAIKGVTDAVGSIIPKGDVIPGLHLFGEGGFAPYTPGGIPSIVAEKEDEYIIPASKMARASMAYIQNTMGKLPAAPVLSNLTQNLSGAMTTFKGGDTYNVYETQNPEATARAIWAMQRARGGK